MKHFIEEQRQFMAFKSSEVAENCRSKNKAILELMCKLTYLQSIPTQNHWIRNLVGIITKTAKDNFKDKTHFDYSWFFELLGHIDEYDVEDCYNNFDAKYTEIKPKEIDLDRLAYNMNEFRLRLNKEYLIKGRLLNPSEVRAIINSLDLYKN